MVLSMDTYAHQVASSTGSSAITVEIPTDSTPSFNPFDPAWVKVWEQAGPVAYLFLLCVLVWLLTRLVETVKGK